jgi:O-antigen/teichoic acid export membrane protein
MSAVEAPVAAELREPPVGADSSSERAADLLSPEKLRAWGVKSAWSLIDQGWTALTGFSVTFLLARWLAPEAYGAYAIAFAGYLFVSGLHNAIVLEPMSVMGPSRHAGRLREYFRGELMLHGVLVCICSAVVALGALVAWFIVAKSPLVGAIAGSGLALPSLLSLFFARRVCYAVQRPVVAMLGSGCCLALTLVGLLVLQHFALASPFAAFVVTGLASALGAILAIATIGWATPSGGFVVGARIGWTVALEENWSYGRWLVGSTMLYSVAGQVQMFLAAAFLGLGAAGILRAMMLPASVMTQAVTAAGLLVLPGFAYDFGRGQFARMRQKAAIVSCVLCAAGLGFAVVLGLVAGRAEHLLFGGKYSGYSWLMPILALIPAANGLTMGYSAALRALQRPHFDLLANAIAAPVAVLSAVTFIRWWGLAGAAASMVMGFAAVMGVNCWVFYVSSRVDVGAAGGVGTSSTRVLE